jgi:hypothetical protein
MKNYLPNNRVIRSNLFSFIIGLLFLISSFLSANRVMIKSVASDAYFKDGAAAEVGDFELVIH